MGPKRTTLIIYMLLFALFLVFPVSGPCKEKDAPDLLVVFQDETFSLQAHETPLNRVLDEIYHLCLVEISGLEDRENERISFRFKGTIEDGIKQLLKYLGEKNFAFEFANERLIHVSVFPEAEEVFPSAPESGDDARATGNTLTTVRIQSIIKGSQAQAVGLKKGDLIIEYDGTRIRSARQLIKEREKRRNRERVDLIVIRDHVILPFVLKGGIIGVRIRTIRIPKDELEYYQSGL